MPTRPPHLETPFSVFNESPITANDAFFVRYHLANIPLAVDLATYRLSLKGTVGMPLSLSLAELKAIAEPVEVVAVNQCSGNSRGLSSPRVFGAQLATGAMGNARWTGVPLRKVLEKAGIKTVVVSRQAAVDVLARSPTGYRRVPVRGNPTIDDNAWNSPALRSVHSAAARRVRLVPRH